MNLYLFIVQIFIYVNTIIQIVVIIFEAIYLLLNRLSFRWSMHLDYFWLTREIEETKTKIENKLQIGKKIDAEQKILDMWIQSREEESKEYKVPLTGIKKYAYMVVANFFIFINKLNFFLPIKKKIIKKYQMIPKSIKMIFFFTNIYLQAEASWCVIYLATYKKIQFPFDLDVSYLPFMLVVFVILNSINTSYRLSEFRKKNTSIETKYFFNKALVLFEAGLPLLTVSSLIGTVIGFSHHNLQYSLLQFFMLIYSPLIPLIFSLKFSLIEKEKDTTSETLTKRLN